MRPSWTCPVYRCACDFGEDAVILSSQGSISYRKFHAAICKTQDALASVGIKRGDRVAIAAVNSVEYLAVLFALWRCGAVACLLSPRLPSEALARQNNDLQCSFLLTDADEILTSDLIHIPKIAFPQVCAKSVPEGIRADNTTRIEYGLARTATVIFTSGSSGVPKPAVHSFGNHYYSALGANAHIPFSRGDRWLLSLPLYHVGGLGVVFRAVLGGGAVVIPDAQEDLSAAIQRNRGTHVSLVPTQLYRLLKSQEDMSVLRGLKAVLLGGSAIPETLMRKALDAALPVYASYGLTEMASQVATSDRLSLRGSFPGARVLNHRQVKIADNGEILVKGQTLFEGYWDRGSLCRPLDNEGWFFTGDLGSLDGQGRLTVLGRKDNMFISGGENIHPEEIERHLCAIEGVLHAVVVPLPDEEFGSRPVAFIEPAEEFVLEKEKLILVLMRHLPRFKIPVRFYQWPGMMNGGSVKIDRLRFQRIVHEGDPAPVMID